MSIKTEELVSKYFFDLNENDLAIWKYISNNKKEASESTLVPNLVFIVLLKKYHIRVSLN